MYAFIMSAQNFGVAMSFVYGALLTELLGITQV
jgi:hypothetical protein